MTYLSKRELEILKLLSYGWTSGEISQKLFISHHTVEFHKKRLFQKFDVRNSNHLVKKACLQGYLTLTDMKDILRTRSLNIIMADDDTSDQELLETAFREIRAKYKLTFVSNGEELINLLDRLYGENAQKLPDIIFLDLNMPVKNGHETLRDLKKSEHYQKIPVFIYSTSNSKTDVNQCYKAGANLFITKPSSFDKITAIIKNIYEMFDEFVSLPN